MSQLPSSSSAGPSLEVKEPWQLTARLGASVLLVALTLPAVVSFGSVALISILGVQQEWGALMVVLRLLGLAAVVLTLVAIDRLSTAPTMSVSDRRAAMLVVVLTQGLSILPTLASEIMVTGSTQIAVALSQVTGIVAQLAVLWVCRRVDRSLEEKPALGGRGNFPADQQAEVRPWPLWNATAVVVVGGAVLKAMTMTMSPDFAFGAMMMSSLLSFAAFAVFIAGVVRLRRRLA
jgi:hypothetical protein